MLGKGGSSFVPHLGTKDGNEDGGFKNSQRDQLGMLHCAPVARRGWLGRLGAGFVLSRATRQPWLGLGSSLKKGTRAGRQGDKARVCGGAGACQEQEEEEEEGSSQHRAEDCRECSDPCTAPGRDCHDLAASEGCGQC